MTEVVVLVSGLWKRVLNTSCTKMPSLALKAKVMYIKYSVIPDMQLLSVCKTLHRSTLSASMSKHAPLQEHHNCRSNVLTEMACRSTMSSLRSTRCRTPSYKKRRKASALTRTRQLQRQLLTKRRSSARRCAYTICCWCCEVYVFLVVQLPWLIAAHESQSAAVLYAAPRQLCTPCIIGLTRIRAKITIIPMHVHIPHGFFACGDPFHVS